MHCLKVIINTAIIHISCIIVETFFIKVNNIAVSSCAQIMYIHITNLEL